MRAKSMMGLPHWYTFGWRWFLFMALGAGRLRAVPKEEEHGLEPHNA